MRTISKYIAVLLLMLTAMTTQAQKHKLTAISTVGRSLSINLYNHSGDGSWNFITYETNNTADYSVSCELAAGDSVKIDVSGISSMGWIYSHMECEGKKIHEEEMGSSNDWPVFIMPDHDVTINVYAEFDPETPDGGWNSGLGQLENPKSPNTNSWNAATGELFINSFAKAGNSIAGTTGGLLTYSYMQQFGVKSTDVKTITVAGEVGDGRVCFSNLGSYNAFPNVEKLDLRHTYGFCSTSGIWDGGVLQHENVFELDIEGLPNLKKLILPSNTEYIGWVTFPQEMLLEEITLYATVPPAIRFSDYEMPSFLFYSFNRIPKSCLLYVPEQSIAAYKADTIWTNHFAEILPIPEGEAEDITVDLPNDFKDGRYVGMSLQLFNARTGEEKKYIIDERGSYIFRSMISDEPYTAQILNPQDVLVATTDTMMLSDKPMEITFKHVKKLYDLTLTVQTPAEQESGVVTDVTDQLTIVWTDGIGNRIATGNTLARQIEGSRVFYGISLPSDLAAHYGVPPRTELVVKEGTANTIITLAQPDSVILSGKVTDTDGKPIAMATVTASLMMNGTVGKTFTTTADQLGRYELTALTGDLTLNVTARGYVSERVNVTVTEEQKAIEPIQLSELSGPTIVYNFTYTNTPAVDEDATTTLGYSDYANVAITAYNETTGQAIDSLMVSYPEVQLLEGAKAGDLIRLTASSLKDTFMPVEATAKLHEEEGDTVTFAIVQKGAIEASFERTNNQAVTASLYDAEGQLVSEEEFGEATMTLSELPDGQYTLVMMGSNPLLNKTRLLSDYTSIGLKEGTDYVQKKVEVKSGTTAVVSVEEVPLLNANPFYYTDATKTLFMPNKTEVSTSCNVTLRAEIGFKDDIKNRVSNVRLLVDYPSNMAEFVEGSSMTGNKMVRATAKDGRLTISVEKDFLDEPVRFILTAIDQGTLFSNAYVQFDIDGREVTQPIGFASCEVKYMTIVAPDKTHSLQFPVRGNAPALCPVRVYAGDDVLVAETQSLADGSWQMHVELPSCPNLAAIPLYAVITTKQGREVKTETVKVTYDQNMIRPLHVYMYPPLNLTEGGANYKAISDKENLRIDFDFDHPETLDKQWYTSYNHVSSPFLFEIVFNTIDSSLVHNVYLKYLTVRGNMERLRAEYDGNTGHWMCCVNIKEDAVCNVDVDFLDETKPLIDADMLYLATHLMDYIKEGFESTQKEMDRVLTGLSTETNQEKRQQLFQELAELMEIDLSNLGEEAETDRTLDEIFADMEAMNAETSGNIDEFLRGLDLYNMDLGENISFTHTEGLTPEQLLDEGYIAIKTTEGNTVYQLTDEGHYVFVDFQNDMRLETKGDAGTAELMARVRKVQDEEFFTKINRENGWLLVMSATISALINEAKQWAQAAHKIFHANWVSEMKREAEFVAKYCKPNSPLLTDYQVKQLKIIQDNKQFQALCSDISNQLGNNGLDIHKAPIPVPITKDGAKLQRIMKNISVIGEVFSWIAVLSDCKEGYDRMNELESIYREIPNPCKEDQSNADHLKKDIINFTINPFASGQVPYFHALILSDVLATETVGGGLKIAPATGGGSMSTVLGGILITLTKIAACMVMNETYAAKISYYRGELPLLNCDEEYRKKQEKYWRAYLKAYNNQFRNVRVGIDPSGYVYEAVADNRVENATATIYFKQTGEDEYGDLHDEVVKWNAEEFRQQNPMLTDAEGKYAWDVPQGLWQVKIEKSGYETAYSDWLPVPPPQLDINIPLVRNTLPEVQTARAYEDGVEVTFNEYMLPESLTTDRILLSQNGQPLTCRIAHQDRSKAYGSNDTYTSRIKVKTESPLANGSKVQLTVRRQVEAYNGLQMQNDYQQEFSVVSEVYAIGTDSIVEVAKGEERTIAVHAFPASAAAGMKVTAKSVIGTIATITDEAIFDVNGEAHLTVKGKTGGQTALLLTLENSKVKAQSVIQVTDPSMLPVYAPTASHISGTYVKEGESVTLHTDTEGAVIWYTTDGTCPCDENGTRKKYTAPISITEAISIRAYAVKGDDASRVVTFNYQLYDPVDIRDANASEGEVPVVYYTPDGLHLQRPHKGVNIIRKSDGTTKSVYMK